MGQRTISTKLAVEGEAQYRQAISACNSELAALKSGLALVESEFRNNANSMEALTAKGAALESVCQKQQEKISTLEDALKNAQRAEEEYASRVSAAQENIERCEKALEKLRGSTEDTAGEQAELTRELEKWTAELNEAQAGQTAAEQGVQRWQKQLNSAKVELNGLSDEIKENNRYLGEAQESADGCAHSIDEFGNKVDKAKDGIQQLATALAAAGVAKTVKEIADELMECAAAAGAFETAMAKLSTLVDTEIYSMDGIKVQLMELSNETGVAVGALAEAAYQARSAGVDTANVVDFVATASRTSVAGFTDSAAAVNVLTTAINTYKLESSEAEKVASMLVKTQDEGKTTVGELAQNMGRVIPIAAGYNVSLGNLTTAYALLTKNGTNTAIATTNLSAMFNELAKKGSAVADVLQKNTGKSFSQLMADGENLSGILAVLSEAVDGDVTAFSNLWGSTTAGQAALSLLNSGAETFTRTLDIIESSSGAVEQKFQTMADTTEFAHQRMANAAQNLRIAIGDQLNPALEKLYEVGASAFTWATDFVEENPWIVNAITGVTVALGTLTAGVLALEVGPKIIGALSSALGLLEAHPIFLMVTAVTGLVAAISSFDATLDATESKASQLLETIKETKEAYDDLMSSIKEQQDSVETQMEALNRLLAVEDKSIAQKESIEQLVEQLNEAIPGLTLAYNREKDALVGLTKEELAEAQANAVLQERYEAQQSRLKELREQRVDIDARLEEAERDLAEAQSALDEAMAAQGESYGHLATDTTDLQVKVYELEFAVQELTDAQEDNAAQTAELEHFTGAYSEQVVRHKENLEGMAAQVVFLTAQMVSLQAEYEESYNAAMESIDGQLGLFNKLDGEAKTTIDSLIDTLKGQVAYMDTYAANLQKAMEMGVDEGLIKKLSDGSEQSAQILAAIVKGGEDDIAALNEQLAKVEEGKDNFASTVAEMETDFREKMAQMSEDLNRVTEEMDVEEEAYKIGVNNVQGLINGTNSMTAAYASVYAGLAAAGLAAYKAAVDQNSPSKEFMKAGRFDIQGLINGAEDEMPKLADTYAGAAQAALEGYRAFTADGRMFADAYEEAAQAALDKMAVHLPAASNVPQPIEALGAQVEAVSAATINAISGLAQNRGGVREVVRLLTVEGRELASYIFDDLADYGDANGTPILNR